MAIGLVETELLHIAMPPGVSKRPCLGGAAQVVPIRRHNEKRELGIGAGKRIVERAGPIDESTLVDPAPDLAE